MEEPARRGLQRLLDPASAKRPNHRSRAFGDDLELVPADSCAAQAAATCAEEGARAAGAASAVVPPAASAEPDI